MIHKYDGAVNAVSSKNHNYFYPLRSSYSEYASACRKESGMGTERKNREAALHPTPRF